MAAPPQGPGGRWTAGRRRRRWLLSALTGLLAAALAVPAAAIWWVDRSIDRVPVDGLSDGEARVAEPADDGAGGPPDAGDADATAPRPVTVLVLGSDSREVLTPEERRSLSTGHAEGERTETIALVRSDPAGGAIRVLSIPRDTLLTRCDDSRGRVNAAYAIGEREGLGGMSCVVRTLTELTGLDIDHAVKVDFRGFVDIVDALGGVPVEVDEAIVDRRAGLDLAEGCTRLDGAGALAFVRARGIDDDFGRMARQQRLIEQLRRELAALGVVDDLPRLLRTVDAVAGAVQLDDSLTLQRLRGLASDHRDTLSSPVEARSIPGAIDHSGTAFLRVAADDVDAAARWLEHGEAPTGGPHPGGEHDGTDGSAVEPDVGPPAAPTTEEPAPLGATPGGRCD